MKMLLQLSEVSANFQGAEDSVNIKERLDFFCLPLVLQIFVCHAINGSAKSQA